MKTLRKPFDETTTYPFFCPLRKRRPQRRRRRLEPPAFSSMGSARFLCALFLLLHVFDDVSHSSVLADKIITSSGARLGRGSNEPMYKVEYHSEDSPFYPQDDQEKIAMANKEGQKYICFLPIVKQTNVLRSATHDNLSSIIMERDRQLKLKTPDELIEVLKDQCFYRHEGWWTYEFCFQKHVKQLHLEDEKVVQEFVLGIFDPDATAIVNENQSDISTLKDPRSKDASQRYHPHQYTNGTICDLTMQPRETEVRFVCSEHSVVLTSIKEISTCNYVVTVHCSPLCRHLMFQQERPRWLTIHCNEVRENSGDSSDDELMMTATLPSA